jgi:hypothetical protein
VDKGYADGEEVYFTHTRFCSFHRWRPCRRMLWRTCMHLPMASRVPACLAFN